MPLDRDALLAEMGLAPVWKLRSPAATAGPVFESSAVPPVETVMQDAAVRTDPPTALPAPVDDPPTPALSAADARAQRELRIRGMDWPALKQAVESCQACQLHKSRKRTVFGVGDEHAAWMLIGEAPGAEEDRLGEPFVGQAGRLLDSMLAAIGLRRQNVYIANVLKCRPPGNRNPEPDEVAQCSPHLLRQIELIGPGLILGMGRFAAQTLLNTDASIASLRGREHRYAGVPLVITYHPAYLLRNLHDKSKVWADLLFARRLVDPVK